MSTRFLDGQDVVAREAMWLEALSRSPARTAIAEVGGEVVGLAWTRPGRDDPAPRSVELSGIYVHASEHGGGVGQQLLDVVLGDTPASLWVAENNPRARAFYRRNGFAADGASRNVVEWENLPLVRMVR